MQIKWKDITEFLDWLQLENQPDIPLDRVKRIGNSFYLLPEKVDESLLQHRGLVGYGLLVGYWRTKSRSFWPSTALIKKIASSFPDNRKLTLNEEDAIRFTYGRDLWMDNKLSIIPGRPALMLHETYGVIGIGNYDQENSKLFPLMHIGELLHRENSKENTNMPLVGV